MLIYLKQLKYRLRLTRTDIHMCLFSFNCHVLTPMMETHCFQISLFILICLGYSVSDFWEPSHLESSVSSTLEAWRKIQLLPSVAYLSQLVVGAQWLVYAPPGLTLRNFTFCPHTAYYPDGVYHKGQVKYPLVQALTLCTNCTAHRGSRGIALLFLDHGTRRG
jgi:hypothetical protein